MSLIKKALKRTSNSFLILESDIVLMLVAACVSYLNFFDVFNLEKNFGESLKSIYPLAYTGFVLILVFLIGTVVNFFKEKDMKKNNYYVNIVPFKDHKEKMGGIEIKKENGNFDDLRIELKELYLDEGLKLSLDGEIRIFTCDGKVISGKTSIVPLAETSLNGVEILTKTKYPIPLGNVSERYPNIKFANCKMVLEISGDTGSGVIDIDVETSFMYFAEIESRADIYKADDDGNISMTAFRNFGIRDVTTKIISVN